MICQIFLAWSRIRPSLRPVTRSVQWLALWLAAFWLPLTMHCQLTRLLSCGEHDACSEVAAYCQDHSCCGEVCPHELNVCKVIEAGHYFLKKSSSLVTWDGSALLDPNTSQHLSPALVILNESTGAPPGWNRVWQFVFRAAPAPRAPSAVC